jgi:predicted phage terminase large subunit-like protein
MNLTKETIYGFTQVYLKHRFDSPCPTPDFHLEVWDLICQDDKYVAVAAPRGHAKSTAVTLVFALACLVFRLKHHILIVSDTETQASLFLKDLKYELLENEELMGAFGIGAMVKDSETEFIVKFKDGTETRVVARGSEQKLRGIKWRNKRPDLVLGDDLENDEIVMNDDRRYKFRIWFLNAMLNVGSLTCHYRIVGTILHLDSMLARLMPEDHLDTTVTDGLRTYSTLNKVWKSVLYRAHTDFDDFSSILWKEMWSEKRLRLERQKYIDDGFPEGYAQEYLNRPLSDAVAYFRKQDFLDIDAKERDTKTRSPETFYASIDMAISTRDSRAYTAIVVVGVDHTGMIRVRDVRRFRGDGRVILEEMFEIQERYRPELFLVEQENISKSLGAFIYEEMARRDIFISMEFIPPVADKIQRARPLQARMRAGRVEIDHEAEWFPAFHREMIFFPRGPYKDQVDALAAIGLVLDRLSAAPTHQEQEDADWESEYESTYLSFDTGGGSGRDEWTGY